MKQGRTTLIGAGLFVVASPWVHAAQDQLAELSLEELGNIQITSVSRRAERLSDAPTSVFVITADDIRRSGASSLPEALRLAPNLQVAQVSATGYTISARGFNSTSANKLLVLIDGRSVYSPLFSGVFWDVQDVMLEDIDRIEVISGPGGTLWGVNAVNGVINVITRSATQTAGGLATARIGSEGSRVNARYGAALDSGIDYRVYATRSDLRHTETQAGTGVDDASRFTQVGFRADWARPDDIFMFKGDAYTGRQGQPLPGTISVSDEQFDLGQIALSGANLIGSWEHRMPSGAAFTVQAYYDRTEREVPPTFTDAQDIVDLQFQYSTGSLGAHRLTWGAEYRYGIDHVTNSSYIAFLPAHLDQTWASLFAQDEISLDDDVRLTLGTRIERNDYTGTEFLPTARIAWKWATDQLLWAAASRTVRAPSRLDHDAFVPGEPPYLLRGGPGMLAETAVDYELGYRGQVTANASLSATVFRTFYDRLHTQEIDPTITYVYFGNGMRGANTGFELWGSYQAAASWRLHAGFSRLRQDFELRPGSNDATSVQTTEGANPSRWWTLRSSLDINARTDVDVTLRYVAALSDPYVPSYTALDLQVGWRPGRNLALSIAGKNLLGNGHGEFTDVQTRTEFGPEVLLKLEYRFR